MKKTKLTDFLGMPIYTSDFIPDDQMFIANLKAARALYYEAHKAPEYKPEDLAATTEEDCMRFRPTADWANYYPRASTLYEPIPEKRSLTEKFKLIPYIISKAFKEGWKEGELLQHFLYKPAACTKNSINDMGVLMSSMIA